MNRNKFIKTSLLILAGIGLIPYRSLAGFSSEFTRDQLIGKGDNNFVGNGYLMHPEAHASFLKMKAEAAEQDIKIEVVSAYRSFQRQKEIFEGKYKRYTTQGLSPIDSIKKIIEYSTIPGTSRHHWGTDIDIIDANAPRPESVLQPQHFHGKGPFCKLKEWLNDHASSHGFIEVYTDNANRKGFKYEPWHFSYKPVSGPMLKAYKNLDVKMVLQEEKILGSNHFTDWFIAQYRSQNILDINPELLL